MPLPAVLDDFNRADETPLDNGGNWAGPIWSSDGEARLQGNRANGSASGWVDSYWATKLPEDQESAFRVAALVTSRFLGPYVRVQNPGKSSLSGYTVVISTTSNAWTLVRVKSEAETTLATGSKAVSVGDWILLRAEGSKVQAVHVASGGSETVVCEKTDTAPVTGEGFIGFAMLSSGTSVAIDDFSGGAIGGEEEALEAAVGAEATGRYARRALAGTTAAASYALREWAGADADAGYAIRSLANGDVQSGYAICETAGAEMAATYALRALVGGELHGSYARRALGGGEVLALYEIAGQPGTVGVGLVGSYAIRALGGRSAQASYALRSLVSAELAAAYARRQVSTHSLAGRYGILLIAGVEAEARYALHTLIGSGFAAAYTLRELAGAELAALYAREAAPHAELPDVDLPAELVLAGHAVALSLAAHSSRLVLAPHGSTLILDPHETEVTLDG